MLEIRLIGDPEFWWNGQRVTVSLRAGAVSLLAYIAVNRDRRIPRASLAALLWPDDEDDVARANLRRHLHLLAKALPALERPILFSEVKYVAWNAEAPVRLDIAEFERLSASEATFDKALDCYRGDFLRGIDDEWVYDVRETLRTRYTELLVTLGENALRSGEFQRAHDAADRLAAADEWREDAVRIKMTALYRLGRQAAALSTYDRFAASLRADMGVEPMVDTVALRSAILANAPLGTIDPMLDPDASGASGASLFPFVGRANEIARLRSAWNKAARGHGTTLFVQGEAGIGKSRLAREVAGLARRQGGCVLVGSTANPQAVPYQPVLGALRAGLQYLTHAQIEHAWLAALADLLPELHAFRSDLPAPEPIDPHFAQQRIIEALTRAVVALARVKPLVLILEDVQWTDDATLGAIGTIARRCATQPLLLIATFRTGDVENSAFLRLRHDLMHEHRAGTLSLGAIAPSDFSGAATDGSRFAATPRGVLERAAQMGGGNPLFVTLLLQAYMETGELPADSTLVASISDAIALRLRAISAEARTLAQVASVIGSAFHTALLAKLTGWDERSTYAALDVLIDTGILRESSLSYEYTFTHALIERAYYESMDGPARPLRHRRVAATLEARGDDRDAATIARHWHLAGFMDSACAAYERASRHAAKVFAWNDARRNAHAALAICEDPNHRIELLRLAVRACRFLGDSDAWIRDIDALDRYVASDGTSEAQMDVLLERIAYGRQVSDPALHLAAIERLIARADAEGAPAYATRGRLAKAIYFIATGDMTSSEALLRHVLSPGQSASLSAEDLAEARVSLANVCHRLGRLDEAETVAAQARASILPSHYFAHRYLLQFEATLAFAKQRATELERAAQAMLELHQRNGDKPQEASARAFLGLALAAWPQRFRHELDVARDLALAHHQGMALLMAVLNRGDLERRIGRFDLAIANAREARAIAAGLGETTVIAHALINEAMALRETEDVSGALSCAQEACRAVERLSEPRVVAGAFIALGAAFLSRGDAPAAIDMLERGVAQRRHSQAVGSLIDDLALLIDAQLEARRDPQALASVDELLSRLGDTIEDQKRPTYVSAAVARAFIANGRQREAAAWIERGRTLMRTMLDRIPDQVSKDAYQRLSCNRFLAAPTISSKS